MGKFRFGLVLVLLLVASPVWAQDVSDATVATDTVTQVAEDAGPTSDVGDAQVVPTEPPKDFEEAFSLVTFLISTAKAGQWPVFAGLIIMLLIFLANRFGLREKVGSKAVPWVAAILGIAAQIALQLTAGIEWRIALFQGFLAGATAVGFWELGFKFILENWLKKPADET